jgi:hypothetical protein
MYLAQCIWLNVSGWSLWITQHTQSLAYACISQWIIKTTVPVGLSLYLCHFTSSLIVFISRWVVLPASTTVIRARKNKKRKKKRGFAILKCNVRCLKLVFLLNFTPRLVSNRHIVIHPLGYGCLIEGGFDIECCNWIFSNFRLSTTYVVMSLNR